MQFSETFSKHQNRRRKTKRSCPMANFHESIKQMLV
eukprot:03272.XXX_15282_15389_1 [CDS] Oithona nana genome sequencing.